MKRQSITLKATNEAELKAELIKISKQNPGKAITAYVSFGSAKAYINQSLSRIPVDQLDTRQMLNCFNGYIAFVDGKLVKPTKGWKTQQNLSDVRNHQD